MVSCPWSVVRGPLSVVLTTTDNGPRTTDHFLLETQHASQPVRPVGGRRGARSSPSRRTTFPTRRSGSTTRRRRSSSGRTASTSTWPGGEARASMPPGTRSRRRTWPGTRHGSGRAIRPRRRSRSRRSWPPPRHPSRPSSSLRAQDEPPAAWGAAGGSRAGCWRSLGREVDVM